MIPSRSIAPDASTWRDCDRCKHRSDRQWFAAPLGKTNNTCRASKSGRALSTTFAVLGPKVMRPSTAHPRYQSAWAAMGPGDTPALPGGVGAISDEQCPGDGASSLNRGGDRWWRCPVGQASKCSGNRNARRNHSPSRSLPPDASTWRLVVTASTDLTVLVRCLSGQDVMYPAPSWLRYPLIHDFRGSEVESEFIVHSSSTKRPPMALQRPGAAVVGDQPARTTRGAPDSAIFSSNRFAATSRASR